MKDPHPGDGQGWPIKAYRNNRFLNSADARPIRVLCEFLEPRTRFKRFKASNTVVFFGSARTLAPDAAAENLCKAEAGLAAAKSPAKVLRERLATAQRRAEMARYYRDAAELARKITAWSKTITPSSRRLVVCSGGGPGIMEACNRGAAEAGGPSVGLNISLPFEQEPNAYQTPELCFEFHYFFIRKFWFVYLAKALVVFPGGFGTFDELFELLTLVQTRKIRRRLPIVIYGSKFWKELVNWDAMVRWGTISEEDLSLFRFCDDVDEAFEYLQTELVANHLNRRDRDL